jgi:hypothetical protein
MLTDLNKFFSTLSPTRLFLTAIVVIAAFWYLNIFLFDRQLISSERFHVPFILSFCLSVLWNLVTLVISFSIVKKPLHPNQRLYPEQEHAADQDWGHNCIFWNIIASVVLLSGFTLLEFFLELHFTTYVLFAFLILILFTGVLVYVQNKSPKSS